MSVMKKLCTILGMIGILCVGAFPALAGDDLPTIKVIHGRTIDNIALYVGVEEGFFKQAGVNVELMYVKGEQNVLAGVLRGDIDAGEISLCSLCKLAEKKIPIKLVSWLGHAHAKTKCGIHVGKDSKYQDLKDIKGLRLATSGSIAAKTLVRRAAELGGYEMKDIRPLWGGRPDNPMQHEAALRSGGVDAFIV